MSHIVKIQTQIRDAGAVAAACQRLQLPPPVQGKPDLFSGEATGLIVRLPAWEYPIVIDTQSGNIQYDNFEGAWGNQRELDRVLQMYAVEKAKIEARKQGHVTSEQALQDGSIKLHITGGA